MSDSRLVGELTKTLEPYRGQIALSYSFLGFAGEKCWDPSKELPDLGEWVSLEDFLSRKSPPLPPAEYLTTKWHKWCSLVILGQISKDGPIIIKEDVCPSTLYVNTNEVAPQYDHFHKLFRWQRNLMPLGGVYIGSPEEMVVFNEQLNPGNDPDTKMIQFPVEEMLDMLNPIKMVQSAVGEFFEMRHHKTKLSIKEAEEIRKRIAEYLAEIDRTPEIVMPIDKSYLSDKKIKNLREQVSKYAVELKKAIPESGALGSDLRYPNYPKEVGELAPLI